MSLAPAFTTPIAGRTTSPDSLLGSIAASLNLPVEDGAAALVWTHRAAITGQLVSKWPTLQFQLQRVGHLTDRLIVEARGAILRPHMPAPPNLVQARAAMILATERSIGDALGFLEDAMDDPRIGYQQDQEARIEALRQHWDHVTPAVAQHLEDFPCVEAALARLIAIDRQRLRADLGLGKSTVRDLVSGYMAWGGSEQVWLSQRMDERASELRPFLQGDEGFAAYARPALVGLAWQLWPERQGWIEGVSRWVQETPDGDPRTSWRDGWEGYDPALSPEGFG